MGWGWWQDGSWLLALDSGFFAAAGHASTAPSMLRCSCLRNGPFPGLPVTEKQALALAVGPLPVFHPSAPSSPHLATSSATVLWPLLGSRASLVTALHVYPPPRGDAKKSQSEEFLCSQLSQGSRLCQGKMRSLTGSCRVRGRGCGVSGLASLPSVPFLDNKDTGMPLTVGLNEIHC